MNFEPLRATASCIVATQNSANSIAFSAVCFFASLPLFEQHTLCDTLTTPGQQFQRLSAAKGVVAFADRVSRAAATILDPDTEDLEVSLDLALTMGHEGGSGVVFVPRGEFYAGGGGASGRSGVGHLGGRGADLGFKNMTKFSLFGSDQATSIAGKTRVAQSCVDGRFIEQPERLA